MRDDSLVKIIETMEAYRATAWDQFPDLDLYMDQVITYLRKQLEFFCDSPEDNLITHSIINNYVKAALVERPVKKKYAKPHLARLFMACLLKRVMPIERVRKLVEAKAGPTEAQGYEAFCRIHEEVLGEEAASLRALCEGSDPPCARELAMRYALKANAARLIADRILSTVKDEGGANA